MNHIALTDDILLLDGRECVRRVGIIEQFYSSSAIEDAHKHGIDQVGEEDEFDVLIQCQKEGGGDGMTKTVARTYI